MASTPDNFSILLEKLLQGASASSMHLENGLSENAQLELSHVVNSQIHFNQMEKLYNELLDCTGDYSQVLIDNADFSLAFPSLSETIVKYVFI